MTVLLGRVEKASELDELVNQRVHKFLTASDLAAGEFAQRAGLSATATADLLTERRSWLLTELAAAANAIGVSVSDLVDPHADGALQS